MNSLQRQYFFGKLYMKNVILLKYLQVKRHMRVVNATSPLHFSSHTTNIFCITMMKNHIRVIFAVDRLKNFQLFTTINVFILVKNLLLVKHVVSIIKSEKDLEHTA